MIKKVRKPAQARVKTSAQTTRYNGPRGIERKRSKEAPKVEENPIPKDELINIDDIILE
jgi:hypothetical protein